MGRCSMLVTSKQSASRHRAVNQHRARLPPVSLSQISFSFFQILQTQLDRAENELKIYTSGDKRKSYREVYNKMIQEQENLAKVGRCGLVFVTLEKRNCN